MGQQVEGKILIASSALKEFGFDALETIGAAVKYGYPGCQLFLDERFLESVYRDGVIAKLKEVLKEVGGFVVVIHLPDSDQINPEILKVAELLAAEVAGIRFLMHYAPGEQIKAIQGIPVGSENVKKKVFDPKEVAQVWDRVLAKDLPMVLDFGRFWYGPEEKVEEIIAFTKWQISRLDPDKGDMIHLTDKVKMADFRTNACVMGSGLVVRVLPEIFDFLSRGGVVILEYEDLEMENASRDYLVGLLG